MMQSCASAVKLRAAGPFFQSASVPCSNTVSRHLGSLIRHIAETKRERRIVLSGIRTGKSFQAAGRKATPSSGSPVVTKRQSAMTSLRASALSF